MDLVVVVELVGGDLCMLANCMPLIVRAIDRPALGFVVLPTELWQLTKAHDCDEELLCVQAAVLLAANALFHRDKYKPGPARRSFH